jgi:hypothetical protein
MHADLRRTIIAFIIAAACVVPLYHAAAFDINDIIDENTTDEVNQAVCQSQRIQNGLRLIQDGYIKQYVRDAINSLKDAAVSFAFQIAACFASPDIIVQPQVLGTGGGGTQNKTPNCSYDIGGAATAALKRAAMDKIKNDFTARCIADGVRRRAGDDARQILLENGPDGGPAYVTNWIDDIYVNEDQRATRRFCAILANTNVCPYMAEAVFSSFPECPRSYFENPPSLAGLGARVDGGTSFIQRAQCTLPDGITPEALDQNFVGYGGFAMLQLQLQPQNNPRDFVRMAAEELDAQRRTSVRAAEAEAIAGGGFRSLYGDSASSCLNRDQNGFCLALGPIRQPAGAVRDGNAAAVQAEFDWINSAKEMNTLMGDVRRRLTSMLLTIDELPLGYEVDFDGSSQDYRDIGAGTRQPDDVRAQPDPAGPAGPAPGGADGDMDGQPDSVECPSMPCRDTDGDGAPDSADTDSDNDGIPDSQDVDLNNDGIPDLPAPGTNPNDPLCTGGNPDCFCVRNDPNWAGYRELAGQMVEAATIANNELVTPPGCIGSDCFVIPGNEVLFLIAICDTGLGRAYSCHPNEGSTDEIVLGAGDTTSFHVIRSDGKVLVPPQSVAACKPGVQ